MQQGSSISFYIPGDVPPKKNNQQIIFNNKTKRPTIIASKRYQAWEAGNIWQLKRYGEHIGKHSLTCTFYPSTKRRFDLSNKLESIQDLLVAAGVLRDDNYSIVAELHVYFGEVSPKNPRVHVILKRLD